MNPQENRIKATAALFLTVSLFLVRGAHASLQAAQSCTITGTPGADLLFGYPPKRPVLCPGCSTEAEMFADGLCWCCAKKREAAVEAHALKQRTAV